MKITRKIVLAALALGLLLGACEDGGKSNPRKDDEKISDQTLRDLKKAHPTPSFKRSQLRQNLIDIVTAQAESTVTTSFFFLEGVGLVSECPSIGFPIASTAQLTNPQEKVNRHDLTLPQIEPTGIYTGDSSGTYVICVDAKGDAYARYWEGYVQTVTGPAEFVDGQVQLTGPSSFDFDSGDK